MTLVISWYIIAFCTTTVFVGIHTSITAILLEILGSEKIKFAFVRDVKYHKMKYRIQCCRIQGK